MEAVHVLRDLTHALRESVCVPISIEINCAYIDSPVQRLIKSKSEVSDGFWYRLKAVKHRAPPVCIT